MKIYEIATGYTTIPAKVGAATEIVVEELVKAFKNKALDVTLVDLQNDGHRNFDNPVVEVCIPTFLLKTDTSLGLMHKIKRVVYSACLARKLIHEIKRNKGSELVFHFHNQYNMFFFLILGGFLYKKRVSILYTNHSYIWHDEWEKIEPQIKRRYFQEVYSMKRADKVFVLNRHAYENIALHVGVSKDHLFLIPNGVNDKTYHPLADKEIQNAKEKYNLKGKKVFIQIGSVCERKNQLESVRLLTPFIKNNDNLVFCFAGGVVSRDYYDEIFDYAKSEGISDNVIYLGEVEPGLKLNEIYNIGEAMIFPTRAEGFSLVILEAMSAGTPVVISDNLEFQMADECLKYRSDESFNELIKSQILDIMAYEQNSKRAREIIEKHFSWDLVADEYLRK